MIKFFRKIRQNLLMENKTGKYFKYAIGEIILVVIGILIALQINNWNENRKTSNTQEKYLLLLKKEAQNNLKALNKSQDYLIRLEKGQEKLLNLLSGDLDTITDNYIAEVLVDNYFFKSRFNYQNNVLSELKTTGELKNISNDSIRSQLMNQEGIVEKVKGQENGVYNLLDKGTDLIERYGSQRRITEAYVKRMDYKFIKSKRVLSNIVLFKMPEFENVSLSFMGTTINLSENHFPNLEEHFKTLIKLIDKELNQLK
jgi:predicted transcriptional regulator